MNDKIAQLNKVIAELNLVAAMLAAGDSAAQVKPLLDQAKLDLAAVTRAIGGIGTGLGQDNLLGQDPNNPPDPNNPNPIG